MKTTPTYGLPYLTGEDTKTDWVAYWKQLADKIEEVIKEHGGGGGTGSKAAMAKLNAGYAVPPATFTGRAPITGTGQTGGFTFSSTGIIVPEDGVYSAAIWATFGRSTTTTATQLGMGVVSRATGTPTTGDKMNDWFPLDAQRTGNFGMTIFGGARLAAGDGAYCMVRVSTSGDNSFVVNNGTMVVTKVSD
ncbi:hypothetical protein [Streptomyces sp. cg35]|uniref:hypothetical protein n=1 Tax=Streptomyces sp. cg35 TaxID=3421650 RepID=UPI003D17573B